MLGNNYEYLDGNYYNYPEYITDKIEFVYNYSINRDISGNSVDLISTINSWVDLYCDELYYNMLQLINIKNIFLVNSPDNFLNNLKYIILQFIDTYKYLLNNLIIIYNGDNPNNISENDFINIKNQIATFQNIIINIDEINKFIINYTYLVILRGLIIIFGLCKKLHKSSQKLTKLLTCDFSSDKI